MDERERSRRTAGIELGIPQLARTYLRQLRDVFVKTGTFVSVPDQPEYVRLARDWHPADLEAPAACGELKGKLEAISLVRCRPEQAIEALVNLRLFGNSPTTSWKSFLGMWFRAITASRWIEYHAVGFENLVVDRPVRLDKRVTLMPWHRVDLPQAHEEHALLEVLEVSRARTWAVLREVATSPYPEPSIRHYPFPEALVDAITVLVSPLVKPNATVYWDSPPAIKPPRFFHDRWWSLSGSVRLGQSDAAKLKQLYLQIASKRGDDAFRGSRSLPDKRDRLATAGTYLRRISSDFNVFDTHVPIATCLEALASPSDAAEISHRVSQRIGVLVGVNDDDLYDVYRHVRALYDMRSKLLHEGQLLSERAVDIRKKMMPKWSRSTSDRHIHGGHFMAPIHVSVEVTRRAVAAAWEVERTSRTRFDPDKLEKALLKLENRRKLRALAGNRGQPPIREWVTHLFEQDHPRDWSLVNPDEEE